MFVTMSDASASGRETGETALHVWWSTHAYEAVQLQYVAVRLLANNIRVV